jgi:alpha-D-ribose 1-methylphosphonate 5-triphosphate synthase subunit PhnH
MTMKPSHEEIILQKVFRRVLQAMSRPGRTYSVAAQYSVSDRWSSLMLVLRTVLDHEVSFCVVGNGTGKELERMIFDKTKSKVADIASADYIIVPDGDSHGEILKAQRGTPEYPDRSATVIFSLPSLLLKEEGKPLLAFTGPGIREEIVTAPLKGIEFRELACLKEINSEYPLGVDTLFIDQGGRVMALPRSTAIEIKEH